MKVSIVVPAFNNGRYIDRCLNSLKNQSYKNIEIIIVNDGSTDNTINILQNYAASDDRIVLIDQINAGTYKSRINGIKKASGDVVLNIDSDDYLELYAIELLVDKMNDTGADVVIGNHFLHQYGRKNLVQNEIPLDNQESSIIKYLLLGKLRGYIWGRLFKKYLLEDINLPLIRAFSEDVLTNFYVFSNYTVKLALVEKGILNYIMHDTNVSNSNKSEIVEGFFNETEIVGNLIVKKNYYNLLLEELASFKCRNWVVYCRKGGLKTRDKKFHKRFYIENYELGKKYLPFYQRIEMIAYSKNLRLGKILTNSMKWTNRYLLT